MVATRQFTVEEIEAAPPDGMWELVDGELVEVTPAADESSSIGVAVSSLLYNHVRAGRLGRVYGAEGGFVIFPDRQTVLAPDVAFVTAERAPQGEARKRFPRLAPDLAVEVRSPSDRYGDLLGKVALYLQAGVRVVWVVDPNSRTVTIFRPDANAVTLDDTMTIDGGEVLPDFSAPIADFFV